MLESLFKKLAGWSSGYLSKKIFPGRRCFPVNFAKFLRTHFFTEHLRWLLLHFLRLLLFSFKKWLNSYCHFATLLWRTKKFFFSTHYLMYKKSNSFVYKFVVNCQVFWITPSGCTLKSWNLAWLIARTILFETLFLYLLMWLESDLMLFLLSLFSVNLCHPILFYRYYELNLRTVLSHWCFNIFVYVAIYYFIICWIFVLKIFAALLA